MTIRQQLIKVEWNKCTYTFCNGEGVCEADRNYPCPECYKGIQPQVFENEKCECKELPPIHYKYKAGNLIYIWHTGSGEDILFTEQEYKLMLSALEEYQIKETEEDTDKFKVLRTFEGGKKIEVVRI